MASGKIDEIFEDKFMTSAKFSVEIEKIVKDSSLNSVSYTHLTLQTIYSV